MTGGMAVPAEVEELISGARLSAHLATSVDDRPHVAPVWYVYEDGVVSFVTGGKKLRNVRENPRVALSIEKADRGRVDWTVTLLGTATVTETPAAVEPVRERVDEKYSNAEDYGFQPLVEVEVRTTAHQVF
jgi:PPOX class probable F420-dependent enzyme